MKKIILILIFALNISTTFATNTKLEEINDLKTINKLILQAKQIKLNENNYKKINEILKSLENKKNQLINNKINKIIIWKTSIWTPIYAYYKWDINKSFFWIISNIHWWYEYWTYKTTQELLKKLNKSNKTQWFIIPTLNPDWLNIAKNDNFKQKYYINWRNNSNNIDLNRSFCTTDFKVTNYEKKWIIFNSSWVCNSQNEILALDYILNHFKFDNIVSLHSTWKIFYIPDNSYYDKRIIDLWEKLKKILPDYYYNSPSYNILLDQKEIEKIEINEWNKLNLEYTWLSENYIYQRYNIPIILIEFENHWEIEYDFLKIINYFK